MQYAVIGLNYGDEGKGRVTDLLASNNQDVLNIRYNGGCQAGHTVIFKNQRHVFSHFGSGTFRGLKTHFTKNTVVNPIIFLREYKQLQSLGINPYFSVSFLSEITTPFDMITNQNECKKQNTKNSCGMGILATLKRKTSFKILDLLGSDFNIEAKIDNIISEYNLSDMELIRKQFLLDLYKFYCKIHIINDYHAMVSSSIFEGAQGLELDAHSDNFPYVTPSRPGVEGIIQSEIFNRKEKLEVHFVTRSYVTRHGDGPFPEEDKELSYPDETNFENDYQGKLRFGRLIKENILRKIEQQMTYLHRECVNATYVLHITHSKYLSINFSEQNITYHD